MPDFSANEWNYQFLDAGNVKEALQEQRSRFEALNILIEEAQNRGSSLGESFFGIRSEAKASEPVSPPENVIGSQARVTRYLGNVGEVLGITSREARPSVRKLSFTMLCQNLPADDTNRAIVFTGLTGVTDSGEDINAPYPFLLEGLIDRSLSVSEFTYDEEEGVVPAQSWVDRWLKCVREECPCDGYFWDCAEKYNKDLSKFLDCLYKRSVGCSLCAGSCAACASCDCGSWCKLFAGCCP